MSSSTTALVAVSVVADVRARDHSTRHAAEKVPAMYFDPCFDLSDPAVFRAVCPDERTSPDDDRFEYIEYKGRTRAKGARAVFHAVRRRHRPGHAGTTEPTPGQGGDQTCRGDRREERVVLRGFRSVTRARRDRVGDLRSDPADSPVASGSIHVRHVSTRVRHEPSQETRVTSARSPTCSRRCRPCVSAARTSTC